MTPLRQRMLEDMEIRNLSHNTQLSYLQQVSSFAKYFQRSPETLGPEEIRAYQVHLTTERKLAPGSLCIIASALRFLYKVTLKRVRVDAAIPLPKKPFKLPVILSREEVARFFESIASRKHRTILMTAYAAGLRVSEVTRLKITDIDSQRMMIRVEQGKNRKDRYVMLSPQLLEMARRHAERQVRSYMQGHGEMDMSVTEGSIWSRITSSKGFTSISHYFVMDWAAILIDIVGGLLIAGALAAWVPNSFWQSFFLVDHPVLAKIWGPLIGPVVAVFSFVCSIGNVPLAAVLWNGGISFGGVASFIFADLIVLPILNIYRKFYGGKVSLFLLGAFYAAMVGAGLIVEGLFQLIGIVPHARHAKVEMASVRWNYTTVLNIVFLALAAILVVRFLRTNGMAMFRMMNQPTGEHGMAEDHDMTESKTTYTCPMHPEVVQDHPGRCPKCGMELEPRAMAREH